MDNNKIEINVITNDIKDICHDNQLKVWEKVHHTNLTKK